MDKAIFREGDNVSLKRGLIHGRYYNNVEFTTRIMFSGSRKVDDTSKNLVKIQGWWYGESMLEITKPIIKHVQHRHRFSPINYRN